MSGEIALDWSAAEVRDGELTVPVTGETGKPFKRAFKATVRLLGEHADWGDVELHKGVVHVAELRPGSEETLRHHLESIVLQAAATVSQAEESERSAPEDPSGTGPDAEMTERFRGFAEPPEGAAGSSS
jgi:hypothetical protein